MAAKKPKSKAAPAKKNVNAARAKVPPKRAKSAPAKPAPAKRDAGSKSKAASAKPAKPPVKGKGAPPPAPAQVKRKPPSITITRPEATRPPPVELPTPKLEAPIGAPNILLPKDGQAVPDGAPILRWMYVGGATRYEVEWSHDSHFGRGHSSSTESLQTALILDVTPALKPGIVYSWRVRGGNDAGWGPWSSPESFRLPDKV